MTKKTYAKTKRKISALIENTVDKIRPEKVILFGSYAYGHPDKDSDIDLLFIKNTRLTGLKRYCSVSNNIDHVMPLDILVKTPSEIETRLAMGDPFYKEIIGKGQVLYESSI